MTTQKDHPEAGERLSLAQRRAYMRLPLDERRERLAAQAERMIEHCMQRREQTERRAWQGEDLVEPESHG